jgi:hypothetical protein
MRKGEIVSLTWPEVDLEAHPLRLANTKEGFSVRPLGQAAVDLLDGLPHHAKSDTVIASGNDGTPFLGLPRAWGRIAARVKLKAETLHTLRHSFATTANTLGCSEPTIAAMLGHSRGTMTSRYVHVVDDALLAAADRVSGAIARAMAGEKPAKVLRIRGTRWPTSRKVFLTTCHLCKPPHRHNAHDRWLSRSFQTATPSDLWRVGKAVRFN